MTTSFYKYHGTGNDFILIDNRKGQFEEVEMVQKMCDRRFGIGADGLILLQEKIGYDFEMVHINRDGSRSMCGNGGRCIVHFANLLGIIDKKCRFIADDGEHEGVIVDENWVELKLKDVVDFENSNDGFYMNTGVPHFVKFVENIDAIDVVGEGRKIRFAEMFRPEGTNVDFVEVLENTIKVATYERGVEGETLSCGTGVTAAAIALRLSGKANGEKINIITKGGNLSVAIKQISGKFSEIWLGGEVKLVFSGMWKNG